MLVSKKEKRIDKKSFPVRVNCADFLQKEVFVGTPVQQFFLLNQMQCKCVGNCRVYQYFVIQNLHYNEL